MNIRFRRSTYIRKAPRISPDTVLGVTKRGKVHRVESELQPGDTFRGVSHWYRDGLGRYFWSGSAIKVSPQSTASTTLAISKDTNESPSLYPATVSASRTEEKATESVQLSPSQASEEETNLSSASQTITMASTLIYWEAHENYWDKGHRGAGIAIAFLGADVNMGDVDLYSNIQEGYNFYDLFSSTSLKNKTEPSTLLAKLLVGKGHGDTIGLVPEAKLFIGKVTNQDGKTDPHALVEALYWVINLPVQLIFLESGLPFPLDELQQHTLQTAFQLLKNKGCKLILSKHVEQPHPELGGLSEFFIKVTAEASINLANPKFDPGVAIKIKQASLPGLLDPDTMAAALYCGTLALEMGKNLSIEPSTET